MQRIIKLTDITTLVCTILCIHMLRVLGHGPRQRGILFLGRGTWDVSDVQDFPIFRSFSGCWRWTGRAGGKR